ncbi:MAG: hypothetical protein JXR83_22935, partial [Deltaproteobacteria bacterium]|nr:hypothetical protein [Deltaproteobacteria bacterium]
VSLAVLAGCGPDLDPPLRAPRRLEQRIRPTHAGALHAYETGVEVLTFDSAGGHFKVWYVTTSADHVLLADGDADQIPDYVQRVAEAFDAVHAFDQGTLGFRSPVDDTLVGASDDGGDSRFDVYLVDFGGAGDGAFVGDGCVAGTQRCAGHMTVENDGLSLYGTVQRGARILASHEYFHAIQAAYDAEQETWWTEATAVWNEEMFDPAQGDFEAMLDGYLSQTDRPIYEPPLGPVPAFAYGLAIWAQFLTERFDDTVVRRIWEKLENGVDGVLDPEPLDATDRVLAAQHGSALADAFAEFAAWNLFTGRFADPAIGYAAGADYPAVTLQWRDLLPHSELLRAYSMSAQYFSGQLDGRAQVTAGFAAAGDWSDLRVAIVLERGDERSAPVWIDDLAAEHPRAVDADGCDRAIAVVVNTATSGASARPTICLGSPDEVHACRFAGAADAGPQPDSGPAADGGDPACGCASASPGALAPAVWLLAALALARRRWRPPGRGRRPLGREAIGGAL